MRRNCNRTVAILLSVLCLSGCFPTGESTSSQAPSKNSTPEPNSGVGPGRTEVILITPNFHKKTAVNPNLISFNTGFMFINPIEQEPEVKVITKEIAPKVLRFPGGTIGNYYHPTGPGYGLRVEETGPKLPEIVKAQVQFKQNAIYHFAEVCKMADSRVMFVANLLTGTSEEMIWCLDFFKAKGIGIAGVELGNEFYFREYRSQFPDVETYIRKAREFASMIKKYDPAIPIAVVAADPTEPTPNNEHARFMNRWNQILGQEDFYDAYVPHLYPKVKGCEDRGAQDLKAVFDCIDLTLATDHFQYHKIVTDHYQQFYGNKKMWITEWNVDAANTTANTMRHAAFVAEFLMGLMETNARQEQLIEYACFHNFGSNGYAAPLFSLTHQTQVQYFKRVGNIAYNTTYFPFLYLSQLVQNGINFIDNQTDYPTGVDTRTFTARTLVSADSKKLYVYFANKRAASAHIQLELSQAVPVSVKAIYGHYAWSVAGLNGFYLKQRADVDLIKNLNTAISSQTATIPGYAVGVIEYDLP
jgi:hypothetical protein